MKLCPQCDTGYPDATPTCPTHGGPLSEIRDLRPGMLIRKTYRIVRLLGKGGMGAVYLAQHELMDAPRALKFLSADLTADEAFTRRFLREGRMLRQIRHKNVVDCGDLERAEDDTLFFAMEFVDGPDLRGVLQACPLEVAEALEIARGIAEGLGAAHALGMVHRDIKPENVLMASDKTGWVPKIADFGIVATAETSTVYKTTRGSLLTPPYAAPEQWRGTRASELDGRTDLYALGGVLFEMLTGQTVFDAENYEGWLFQHLETPPRPPSSLRPEVAQWTGLDALLLRLLAKNRDNRPANVAEFLPLLDAIRPPAPQPRRVTVVEQKPPRAATEPMPNPAPEPRAPAGQVVRLSPDPEPAPEQPKAKRRLKWRWEFLIFAVVAMVFFISWYDNKQKQDQAARDLALQPASGAQPQTAPNNTPSTQDQDLGAVYRQAAALDKQGRYNEARPLYDQACNGGFADACYGLGSMYYYSHGVAEDFAKALTLYTKACEGGSGNSCGSLGAMYSLGRGVPANLAMAATYYDKACDAGIAKSCSSAGNIYENGRGVAKDLIKATASYNKACKGGDKDACNNWLVEIR